MCRFVAYLGSGVLLEHILVQPNNSIIMQSLHARESTIPTNGDGFGVGWYAPEISPEPALFTSISPAWNDRNLLQLTAKIKSPCFFAHIRAAGAGGVTTYNCHPFVHDKWMLMHNGDISDFILVKRHLRHLLEDDIYHWIQGETDSEHLFALFLQFAKGRDLNQLSVVADVLRETILQINELVEHYSKDHASYYNLCLTDGKRIVASRYCTVKGGLPESLHYFSGKCLNRHLHKEHHEAVVVSSEILTEFKADWQDVPANSFLLVDYDRSIKIRPF
ncbi:class II glutamine amidotransferase [Legionella micdadei]|uniref:class II glutamine amidotransferase n=1 Tax=Legionella micdadei TaxID=451 RepID=UPI0009EF6ED5|nr:class II glutamine amidotransferase [Legionella micdadei]ARH01113.1 class II glutamine amidotransferase [Legionella micdadei]